MLKLLLLGPAIALALLLQFADAMSKLHPKAPLWVALAGMAAFGLLLAIALKRRLTSRMQCWVVGTSAVLGAGYLLAWSSAPRWSALWFTGIACASVAIGAGLRIGEIDVAPRVKARLKHRLNARLPKTIAYSGRPRGAVNLPQESVVMQLIDRYWQRAHAVAVPLLALMIALCTFLASRHAALSVATALVMLGVYSARRRLSRVLPWIELHAKWPAAVLLLAAGGLVCIGWELAFWPAALTMALAALAGLFLGKVFYLLACAVLLPVLLLNAGLDRACRQLSRWLIAACNPLFVRHLRRQHPEWLDKEKRPLLDLSHVLLPDWRVFVAAQRYLGKDGMPLFSAREMASSWRDALAQSEARLHPPKPQRHTRHALAAGAALASAAALDLAYDEGDAPSRHDALETMVSDDIWQDHSPQLEHQWINPGSGLPTVGNTLGGIDLAGNAWGENHW